MGIKERRTKILLALFLLSDVDFNHVPLNQNTEVAFDLSMNQKTKGTLSSLIKEGLIEKKEGIIHPIAGEEPVNEYKLTEKGFLELSLGFPFFRYLKTQWDGKWRILSY